MLSLYSRLADTLAEKAGPQLPLIARFVFAATLFFYYFNAGLAKLGGGFSGLFSPGDAAYVTIFPKALEAAGYDSSQLGIFHWAVAFAGTWAEILLPIAIVLGLFTRLAAFGMIGVVIVQSLVDIWGHGVGGKDLGTWFDQASGALIMDQRTLWVFLLLVLVVKGAGVLSLDRVLKID